MKKILFAILAAAAMSAACTQFEEETVPTYDSAAKPEVTATVVSDTEVTVTVTAGAGADFWGYAVMTGAPGATADKLVANGYAKDAAVVVQGEEKQAAYLKYTEETKTVTLELSGLTPFTEYTVYAAAVTKMGVLSEVAEVTVKTTDGTAPVLTAVAFEEADEVLTFAISFNDPVALTGNGTAKAWFYGENYYDSTTGALSLYKEVDIPATHIAASGKNLLVAVPATEYVPGAYVAVTYSADIVKNGAGAVNVAYDTHVIGYDSKGAIQKMGIFGYYDYANWDFSLVDPATLPDEEAGEGEMGGEEDEEEKVPVYFNDWSKLMMLNYTTSEYPLATKTKDAKVTVTTAEADGRTVTYDVAAANWGIVDDNIAGVMLNEAPEYGSTVSYTIAEGSVEDLFGNVNNEFTAEEEYYFSYGYTLADIIGTYSYTGVNAAKETSVTGKMTIEASDDTEEGNFMITSFAGLKCTTPIYGDFNPDSGSIDIYGEQPFYEFVDDNDTPDDSSDDVKGVYIFYTYTYYWLNMSMTKSGYISNPNDIFGIYVQQSDGVEGWALPIYGFSAQKVEEEETPAQTSSPAKTGRANLVELPTIEKK